MVNALIKKGTRYLANLAPKTRVGRYFLDEMIHFTMESSKEIRYNDCTLRFTVPNRLNRYRIETFSTKEPETLEWIDALPEGSVLWDIGANIGIYSCYAAKKRGCRIYAFEPSVFNLELLARNIYVNGLVDRVTIVPLPLSNVLQENTLNMTSKEWGGALSTFGETYGDDGKPLNKIFEFSSIGIPMDSTCRFLNIPERDFIKMDVDGIEHLILKGGISVLSRVKGIIIEVNEAFEAQNNNIDLSLHSAGLELKEKRHSELFENNMRFGRTYNQIWYRP